MARNEILRRVRIELDAGNATPAEVGKMLGPYGLNLREVMQRYNDATAGQRGDRVPMEGTVFADRTYELTIRTPPTSFPLPPAANRSRPVPPAAAPEGARRQLPPPHPDDPH